jgi:hypothetical protein
MSRYLNITVIVEGKTELTFIEKILAPYLGNKNIFMTPTQVSKPGQKGGDVKFSRVKNDIGIHLKQRNDTYVSTFVDYYGIKEWPGLDKIDNNYTPKQISELLLYSAKEKVISQFSEQQAKRRFIPYIAVHEFEALLFSDVEILSSKLNISVKEVEKKIKKFKNPEEINKNPNTAPSKILKGLLQNGKFYKISSGIAIAKKIGLVRM